jgi:hypothetical protein
VKDYPDFLSQAGFNAFLDSSEMKQAVWVSRKYEPISKGSSQRGYRIEVEGLDGGQFELVVALYWFHSSNEPHAHKAEPILVGSHSFHEYSGCDLHRSEVWGSRKLIHVHKEENNDATARPLLDLIVPSNPQKCTSMNEPGRWLRHAVGEVCRPPYCTGDLAETIISKPSWQGIQNGWVWVPYACHYHAYSQTDFLRCAEERNVAWIHVMGDSLAREYVGYLMSLFHNVDTSKFESADVQLGSGKDSIRLTFQSWQDVILLQQGASNRSGDFTETMLNHWNILGPGASTPLEFPKYRLSIPDTEVTRPDVFIMNPATAYSLFKQTEPVSS